MTHFLNNLKGLYEKKKQLLFLYKGKRESYKLDCRDKIFPIKVNLDISQGIYEIYVSKSIMRPDENSYDMMFTVANFVLHGTDETQFFFFTFAAKSILKICIYLEFSLSWHEGQIEKKGFQHRIVKLKKTEGAEFAMKLDLMTLDEKKFYQKDLGIY